MERKKYLLFFIVFILVYIESQCQREKVRFKYSVIRMANNAMDPLTRSKAASFHKYLPDKTLEKLAKDPFDFVRKKVAENPNAPEWILHKLTKDVSPLVRAANPKTPLKELIKLAQSTNEKILRVLAKNPSTPAIALTKTTKYGYGIANPNMSTEILSEIIFDEDAYLARKVRALRHPNVSKKVFEIFATHENKFFRFSIASNPNVPMKILESLSDDKYCAIRKIVASSKKVSKEILVKLSKDKNCSVRLAVAHNKNTPKNILVKLSMDASRGVRKAIASNKDIPRNILIKLTKDEYHFVRAEITNNENIPKNILKKLSNDRDHRVRARVASNKNAPKNILKISTCVTPEVFKKNNETEIYKQFKEISTRVTPSQSNPLMSDFMQSYTMKKKLICIFFLSFTIGLYQKPIYSQEQTFPILEKLANSDPVKDFHKDTVSNNIRFYSMFGSIQGYGFHYLQSNKCTKCNSKHNLLFKQISIPITPIKEASDNIINVKHETLMQKVYKYSFTYNQLSAHSYIFEHFEFT